MIELEEISKEVQGYNPKADLAVIQKAYDFAEKVHRGQKRISGDPYVIHPLEVAQILSVMKLDVASITAGLLHDTVEDTSASLDEIKQDFGVEIATLVDGVTKMGT